jgi:hypothetical protein
MYGGGGGFDDRRRGGGGGGHDSRGSRGSNAATRGAQRAARGGDSSGSNASSSSSARAGKPSWLDLPALRSYRQFLQTQENGLDGEEAQRRYEVYKTEYTDRITKQFYDTHKDDEWFRDKYDPERIVVRRNELAARSRLAALTFGEQLLRGSLHWRLDADHPDNVAFAPFLEHDNASVRTPGELQLTSAAADARAAALAAADLGGADSAVDDDASKRALEAAGAAVSRDMERRTVHVKGLPPSTTRAALDSVFRAIDGLERVHLSDPSLERMTRRAWITYSTVHAAQRAATQLGNHPLALPDGAATRLSLQLLTPHRVRVRVVPPALSLPERQERDVGVSRRLVELLDREKGLWPPQAAAESDSAAAATEAGAADGDEGAAVGTKRPLAQPKRVPLDSHPLFSAVSFDARPVDEKLDLLVTYLRRVHNFCFYTGNEFDSEFDLERVRGPIHLRYGTKRAAELVQQQATAAASAASAASGEAAAGDGSTAATTTTATTIPGVPEADVKWMTSLDERLQQRLSVSESPDATTAATLIKRMLEEFVEMNSEMLDDSGKHQCRVCPNKVFKEKKYVEKHLFNKHQDLVDQVRLAALIEQTRLNYVADPQRLRPEERGVEDGNNSSSSTAANGGGRNDNNRSFHARLGPRQPMPMPTNVRADPRARAVRQYTDLDTPAKGAQIDYGFD